MTNYIDALFRPLTAAEVLEITDETDEADEEIPRGHFEAQGILLGRVGQAAVCSVRVQEAGDLSAAVVEIIRSTRTALGRATMASWLQSAGFTADQFVTTTIGGGHEAMVARQFGSWNVERYGPTAPGRPNSSALLHAISLLHRSHGVCGIEVTAIVTAQGVTLEVVDPTSLPLTPNG